MLQAFGRPEISSAFEELSKAGAEMLKLASFSREKSEEVMGTGFPMEFGGESHAPFDMIGDFIRGTRVLWWICFRDPISS